MALFNELMVSVYLYLMMGLTDFHGENPLRSELGYILLGLVVFTVLVNFLKALWFAVMGLKCTKKLLYSFKIKEETAPNNAADLPVIQPIILMKPTK